MYYFLSQNPAWRHLQMQSWHWVRSRAQCRYRLTASKAFIVVGIGVIIRQRRKPLEKFLCWRLSPSGLWCRSISRLLWRCLRCCFTPGNLVEYWARKSLDFFALQCLITQSPCSHFRSFLLLCSFFLAEIDMTWLRSLKTIAPFVAHIFQQATP